MIAGRGGVPLLREMLSRHRADRFSDLHEWSVREPAAFWREAWTDLGIAGDPGGAVATGEGFVGTRWFPEGRLNIVDTLLAGPSDALAILALGEDGARRSFTRDELRDEVAACAAALRECGVVQGDVVAAWMPNVPETAILALGALSLGVVVSTASPDFGPTALVDRLGQVGPVVLLVPDGYCYSGRWFDVADRLPEVLAGLPTVRTVVVVPGDARATAEAAGSVPRRDWDSWLAPWRGTTLETVALPFDHPGFVLFSSGTTGRPKAIVHRAAGVLLKDLSEQGYHLDIRPGDRVLYVTTCGWMMWNWLLMALGRGAAIVLVDGSPGHPDLDRLWQVADDEDITFLGVSAALIDAWRSAGLNPAQDHDLSHLRTIASTGSPLAPSGYDWVAEAVSDSVHLASISGGTDLCGCFVLGVATEPVHRGEIQGPALGLDVTVLRADGSLADTDETGELVCRTPFPSVPVCFVGDDDGSRFMSAYFERFPGVWAHGDYARRTSHGGFEILGRSDATLNAKGVRIGTAEIYRVVTALPEIRDALAVGQQDGDDTRIVLFVQLVPDTALDAQLTSAITGALRRQASPRHVPAVIAAAPDLPRTRSGKLAELVVADIANGRPVRSSEALANPECLEWFREWQSGSVTASEAR